MAKSALRIKARQLRRNGLGLKTIAHQLRVSSSTVSLWCQNIMLTEKQIIELGRRSRDPYYGKRLLYIQKQQKEKEEKIGRLTKEALKQVSKMSQGELFYTGIALYWAEGFKKDNLVGFANSDPAMVMFFIQWLEKCCNIYPSRLKLRVGVNNDYRSKIEEIENYWSETIKIPKTQFQKPFFQQVKWKKIYENPENYHGVVRIRVSKSTDLLRTIRGWIEGLKQNVS